MTQYEAIWAKNWQSVFFFDPKLISEESRTRPIRPCRIVIAHMPRSRRRHGADSDTDDLESCPAHQRSAINAADVTHPVLHLPALSGDFPAGRVPLGAAPARAATAATAKQHVTGPWTAPIPAKMHAPIICRGDRRPIAGTLLSLRAQGRVSWAAAVLAFLNTLFAVAGQEAFWRGAVPTQVFVGQRVTISLTGAGFLVGANDYSCLFQTEVVNQYIGEFEVRYSPLEILAEGSAECTTPEWDLPAMDTTLKIVKNDMYVRAEGPMTAFRFLHALRSSEPTEGPASGSQMVTISGYGFGSLPGSLYTSIFTGSGGVQVTSVCTPDAISSSLVCETPKWPSSAGITALTIQNNGEVLSGILLCPY